MVQTIYNRYFWCCCLFRLVQRLLLDFILSWNSLEVLVFVERMSLDLQGLANVLTGGILSYLLKFGGTVVTGHYGQFGWWNRPLKASFREALALRNFRYPPTQSQVDWWVNPAWVQQTTFADFTQLGQFRCWGDPTFGAEFQIALQRYLRS